MPKDGRYKPVVTQSGDVHVLPSGPDATRHKLFPHCACGPDKQWDRERLRYVYLHRED